MLRCKQAAGVLAGALAMFCAPAAVAAQPELRVLSNRAELISGGDALVEAVLPPGTDRSAARVFAGDRDVTGAFAVRADGRFTGLVRGLPNGRTVLALRLPGGGAQLPVTNHPLSGPVFAGPQTQPWVCSTEENGLGKPQDAACSVPPTFEFFYRSTDPSKRGFQAYDSANPPSDVAMTTTDQGREVPFVVRVETGVIDRGIYQVGVLYDPKGAWEPWAPQPGWNGKVVWPFGGDCKPWHVQDAPVDVLGGFPIDPDTGGAVEPGADETLGIVFGNANAAVGLSRGFMVANSALNKYGSQCNSVVSAEALMMVKEHIVETYGPIRYTIGAGSSGGSMQQHQIAAAYPGLLDGIQPAGSFPDIWETMQEAEDCHLLNHYFDRVSPHLWAAVEQQQAVTGYQVPVGCRGQWDGPHGYGTPAVGNYAGMWLDPDNAPGCGLPAEQVYARQANVTGVRCTLPDYMSSIFGRRPGDGFANRPFDNVGVQYGLHALQSGTITAEQFVDLNEKVGGLDIDWEFQPQRSVADEPSLEVAYRAGLVTNGRELAKVPTIDIRGGGDNFEIHSDFHTYVTRARLDRDAGGHDSQVVFTGARPLITDPTSINVAFDVVDEWLARVEADRRDVPLERKVRDDRPAAAVDTCWFEGRPVTDPTTCRTAFPYYADPRIAAGGPFTDDVLKCRLKPLDRRDYKVSFSEDQWARLHKAFPTGVCDYRAAGVGQQPVQPWTSFAAGPGGHSLGDPPRSAPLGTAADRPAPCASAAGFRSVAAVAAGRGLRLDADRRQSRRFTVDVFQQSAGRRVVRERLIARFADRDAPFTWDGRDRKGPRLADGFYFVRFTMRLDDGMRDVRRVALRRVRGRFRRAPDFHQRVDCGLFGAFKLSGAAFGGVGGAPLGIAVRLARGADRLAVDARVGRRVVRRWSIGRPRAGRTYRLRLPAPLVARGREVAIGATVVRGGARTSAQRLRARRI